MQVEIFNSACNDHFKQKYHHGVFSMLKNIRNIAESEGVLALWKGLPPTLLGIIHPLVFFPMYEKMKIHCK